MNISWKDIETMLLLKNASINEVNTLRQIFNSQTLQDLLLIEFGILTSRTFTVDTTIEDLKKLGGALQDLADLDTFDLIDFIASHEMTFRQAETITPQQMMLLGDEEKQKVSRALLLVDDDENQDYIRYIFSAIVQTGFPYRKLKGKQHFERKNGDLTVTMSAPDAIGLPAGIYPRLLFVYICSEVIKSQDRFIDLGVSLRHFVVNEMGRPWTTGKRGTAIKWQESLISLLATSFTITCERKGTRGSNTAGLYLENVSISNKAQLWWSSDYDGLKGAQIEVSEHFANALLSHAAPLDYRALKSLSALRSPLAFDLYCWLTYRFSRMTSDKTSIVRISWESLRHQLGTEAKSQRHFVYDCRVALNQVKNVYPAASFIADDDKILVLLSSPPHIAPVKKAGQALLDFDEETTK